MYWKRHVYASDNQAKQARYLWSFHFLHNTFVLWSSCKSFWQCNLSRYVILYLFFFSCDQAALRTLQSVRPSVRLSVRLLHLFHYVPISMSSWNLQELLPMTDVMSMQKVKVRGQRSRSQRSWPHLAVSGPKLQFEFTYGNEMMHKAWCYLGEVPYCFWRSSVKFQGHTALKIVEFHPDWAFPDCNSSLNSPMATKWCTKLEVA